MSPDLSQPRARSRTEVRSVASKLATRTGGWVTEQLSVAELRGPAVWDVVVIGAGPAGSICSRVLATAGLRVLLVDRSPFPREKVCGDALIADALRLLERHTLLERVASLGRWSASLLAYSTRRLTLELPGRFLTIERRDLDAVLAAAAIEAGATFAQGTAESIDVAPPGGATVRFGAPGAAAVRARLVVVATGANGALLDRLGAVRSRHPSAAAVRCYVKAPAGPRSLVASLDATILPGYGWIFPLPDGWFNVGCGCFFARQRPDRPVRLHERFAAFSAGFPPLRELLSNAEIVTRPVGAALSCGLLATPRQLPAGVVAVGETIGTTFPLTGEGIGKAMESGELAAQAIVEALGTGRLERLASFGEELAARFAGKYSGYLLAEEWLPVGWFHDLVVVAGRSSAWIRRRLAGVLDETTDLDRFFRLAARLRRF